MQFRALEKTEAVFILSDLFGGAGIMCQQWGVLTFGSPFPTVGGSEILPHKNSDAPANNRQWREYVFGFLSICPLTHSLSLLTRGIAMKLDTNIHPVSGKSCKGFKVRSHRSRSSSLCFSKCS